MPIAQKSQPTGLRGGRRSSQAHAPEFGEDLRRERRGSGAADAPKHLRGMLTLLWNPPVQGVEEQIKELEHRHVALGRWLLVSGAHALGLDQSLQLCLRLVVRLSPAPAPSSRPSQRATLRVGEQLRDKSPHGELDAFGAV